jgi:hypothetical protein
LNRIQIYCDDKQRYSYVKFLYRYNDEIKNIEIRINLLHRVKSVAGGFVVRKNYMGLIIGIFVGIYM